MVNESELFLKEALNDTLGNCGRLSTQSIEPSIVRRSSHPTYHTGAGPTHRWVIDNRCAIFNRRTIASLCAISSRILIVSAILLFFLCSYLCVFAQEAGYDKKKIKFLTAIYGYGERDRFRRPTDIFVDSRGDIYLSDFYKEAVFIFDSDFMPIAKIDKVNGLLARPICVAANDGGVIFVSEESTGGKPGRLLSFNFRGEFKKQIKFKGFTGADTFSALDIAIDQEGNLYLAGGKAGLVILGKGGRYLKTIRSGTINSEYIRSVEVKDGNIYILNSSTCRISVYDGEGNFIYKFGRAGGVAGTLSQPKGMAVDTQTGLIYIVDKMRHCLSVYDQKGKYLFEYGGLGTRAGWFSYPKGIFIDQGGRLLVADTFNQRVQVFTMRN